MTALEKRNRLHQRKGLWLLSGAHHHHHNDTVGKPLPRAVVPHRLVWKRDSKLQKPLLVVAGVAANGGGGNNIPRMIRIDATTLAMIQLEVQELLRNDQQQQQQCTVLTLANALAGSRNVIDVYAECATTMEDLESVAHPKLVSRSFRDRVLFRRKPKMDPVTNRKYAIVNALNRLQETPKSSTTPVTSWEDAMEALSKVMHFPEDDAGADENATAARNEHTSKTKGDSVDDFVHRMRQMRLQDATLPGLRDSQRQWLEIATYAAEPVRVTPQLEEEEAEKEKGRLQEQEREREAQERASDLLRPLKPDERQRIFDAMDESAGPDDEVICTTDTDSIQRASLRTLRPHEWLNDEVIHYFLVMLSKRDEQLDRPKRTHFFKSFFMTKLRNEGNADPALDGVYCYANVKRWSKKVTGKDIFNLDKIIFPINQGNSHWTSAVAFMQERRVQYYDSMGGSGIQYLRDIFQYIQDEHRDKKKCPLPNVDDWKLVPCTRDTPRQHNGYDCGVFTCMFADFISKDCPLDVLGQDHITQCRERIALSILEGQAIL